MRDRGKKEIIQKKAKEDIACYGQTMSSVRKKAVVVGMSGGSSAGKTAAVNKIIESIGKEKVAYVQ